MTHASIVPIRLGMGCSSTRPRGVVGVDARNGQLLWDYPGWTVNTANVPSPVDVGNDRYFHRWLRRSACSVSRQLALPGLAHPAECLRLAATHADLRRWIPQRGHGPAVRVPGLSGRRVWAVGIEPSASARILAGDVLRAQRRRHTGAGGAERSGWHELARAVLNGPDAWVRWLAGGPLVCRRDTIVPGRENREAGGGVCPEMDGALTALVLLSALGPGCARRGRSPNRRRPRKSPTPRRKRRSG